MRNIFPTFTLNQQQKNALLPILSVFTLLLMLLLAVFFFNQKQLSRDMLKLQNEQQGLQSLNNRLNIDNPPSELEQLLSSKNTILSLFDAQELSQTAKLTDDWLVVWGKADPLSGSNQKTHLLVFSKEGAIWEPSFSSEVRPDFADMVSIENLQFNNSKSKALVTANTVATGCVSDESCASLTAYIKKSRPYFGIWLIDFEEKSIKKVVTLSEYGYLFSRDSTPWVSDTSFAFSVSTSDIDTFIIDYVYDLNSGLAKETGRLSPLR